MDLTFKGPLPGSYGDYFYRKIEGKKVENAYSFDTYKEAEACFLTLVETQSVCRQKQLPPSAIVRDTPNGKYTIRTGTKHRPQNKNGEICWVPI